MLVLRDEVVRFGGLRAKGREGKEKGGKGKGQVNARLGLELER